MMLLQHYDKKTTSLHGALFLIIVILFSCHNTCVVLGLSTVVYGPQSRELLLLVSKLASKEGIDTSFICAEDIATGCNRLLYGEEYANNPSNFVDNDNNNRAKPIYSGEDIQQALEKTNSMVLINYDNPVEPSAVQTFLKYCGSDLKNLVVLSKMGISKQQSSGGGGGFFSSFKPSSPLLQSELAIQKEALSRGLNLSIVRAGNLKGGGAGDKDIIEDVGLDKSYYNTIFDIVEANVCMAYDKYTLGAKCTPGDTIEMPNMMQQMGTKASFEPIPSDTSRIVVANAVVACLLANNNDNDTGCDFEFSVSSEKGTSLPSREEWMTMLESCKKLK